ncbi:MAG: hypothetical protein MK098_12245 [Marinovum sp.]|nr:hypothetical protein [Marinovum sp.]
MTYPTGSVIGMPSVVARVGEQFSSVVPEDQHAEIAVIFINNNIGFFWGSAS